jgi:hypothetical protein
MTRADGLTESTTAMPTIVPSRAGSSSGLRARGGLAGGPPGAGVNGSIVSEGSSRNRSIGCRA